MIAAALLTAYVDAGRTLTDLDAVDWLRFALHPWDGGPRRRRRGPRAVARGRRLGRRARLAPARPGFRVPAHGARRLAIVATWIVAAGGWCLARGTLSRGDLPWDLLAPVGLAIALASALGRILRWRRHSSRAAAVVALFLALALPALSMYPAAFAQFDRARRQLIESRLGPEATRQRSDVQLRVGRVDGTDRCRART